jgi:hypothetical protein
MKKIKFKLTKSEVKALVLSIEVACTQGANRGLTNMAAHVILGKLYLRLLGRMTLLNEKNNSVSFSIPELWALNVQTHTVGTLLGMYEKVLLDKIGNEARRLTA